MIRYLGRMQEGFSLIELMIALVLGLLVVSTAIGIFLSNKQAYMATQGLGRVQESSQVAFELMSRDIREAGGNPCDTGLVAGNIIAGGAAATPTGTDWYLAVTQPLHGFESGGPTHVADTDDVRSLTADTTAGSGSATYSPGTPAYTSGAAIMICDMKVLGVFKANGASSISGANGTVSFAGAGNACNYFPQPNAGTCAGAATAYQFPKFATLSALEGVRWFVRDSDGNASNGYSLYRQVNGGTAEEVVQGVENMQVKYLTTAGYVDAGAGSLTTAAAWNEVRAARVTLTLRDTELSGTDGTSRQPIRRTVENVITLRNRVL
jgi:type IV pilus assembly protein PilW